LAASPSFAPFHVYRTGGGRGGGGGITAQRAADFQAIWGTAGNSCGSQACTSLANDIAYTGIKQWRDRINTTTADAAYAVLASIGMKVIALPWYTSGNLSDIPTHVANLQTM